MFISLVDVITVCRVLYLPTIITMNLISKEGHLFFVTGCSKVVRTIQRVAVYGPICHLKYHGIHAIQKIGILNSVNHINWCFGLLFF